MGVLEDLTPNWKADQQKHKRCFLCMWINVGCSAVSLDLIWQVSIRNMSYDVQVVEIGPPVFAQLSLLRNPQNPTV